MPKSAYNYTANDVFIKDMTVDFHIGVSESELALKQPVVITVAVSMNSVRSESSDDILDTIDYSELYSEIKELGETTEYHLLEKLAGHIIAICLKHPLATKVSVTLEKPRMFQGVKSVGVQIMAERMS